VTATHPEVLHGFLEDAAARGDDVAVVAPGGGSITYAALAALTARVRDRLVALGVRPGDRVGVYLPKSIDSVATILGILRAGAAYVPVDPTAPVSRDAFILSNCGAKVVVVEEGFRDALAAEMSTLGALPLFQAVASAPGGTGLAASLGPGDPPVSSVFPDQDALAYILYTSGSTGKPKGVTISHRNAVSFVDWCGDTFAPRETDRFSSHAPFHFDLSILDIYTPLRHGAALVLVGEKAGKEPLGLAELISRERITVWYSAPSILSMLAGYGKMETHDYAALRLVLFAGEVFPVPQLRALQKLWPHPGYYNLYGPTETNVCTYYPVPGLVPDERTEPLPIGPVCEHLRARVVDPEGGDVPAGEEGELCIAGPSVMGGYWGRPDLTAPAYLPGDGERWYRTGDIVVEGAGGEFTFRGRRDRMVKRHGNRVELGEIEACLHAHPEVHEAAVVAVRGDEGALRIQAHLATRDGSRLSIIKLKQFCAERIPVYMIPDGFTFHEALPKTSTDKTDYQKLVALG